MAIIGMKLHLLMTWGKIYCDNGKLYDPYHTLIDGEHILLLKLSISKN